MDIKNSVVDNPRKKKSEKKPEGNRLVFIFFFFFRLSGQSSLQGPKAYFFYILFLVLCINIVPCFHYFLSIFSSALNLCLVMGSLYSYFADVQ